MEGNRPFFVDQRKRLSEEWKREAAEVKEECKLRAREGRSLAALVPTKLESHQRLMESLPLTSDEPWGLGATGEASPLCTHALQEHLKKPGGFRQSAEAWAERHIMAMPAETMPEAARCNARPCLAGECGCNLPRAAQEAYRRTLRGLFLATKYRPGLSARTQEDLIVLRFSTAGKEEKLAEWVVVLHHGKRSAAEGTTVCRLTARARDPCCNPPLGLRLAQHKRELVLLTETSFVQGLMARRQEVWHIEVAEWDPEAEAPLQHFSVQGLKAVDITALEYMENAARQAERARRALSQEQTSAQPRRRGRRGRGGGGLRAAETSATATDAEHSEAESAEAASAPLLPVALAPLSPTRTPPERLPALEQYVAPAAMTPPQMLPPLQQHHPPMDVPAPAAEVRPRGAGRNRPAAAGDRVHAHFGPFPISAVMAYGGVSGYGVVCGRHGRECRKQLHMGSANRLSDEEVVLRLKRWRLRGST